MTSRNDLPSVILTRPSIAEQGQTSISQPQTARPASRTSSELYLDSPFGSPNPNASPSGSPVWSPAAASSGGSSYFPSPVLGPTNPSIIAGQSAGRNQHGYPTPPSQSDSGRNSPALSEVNSRPYLHRLDSLPGVTRGRGRQYSGTSDGSASSSPVRGYGKRVYSETYGLGLDEPEGPSTPPYTPEEATAGTKSGGRGMSGSVNLGALIDGRLERRGGGGVEEQYPAEQEYAEEKEHNKKRANPVLRVLRLVMPYTAVARILNMASGSSSSSGAIPFARGGKSNNKYSRRESTGTSSATIRSKKQDQRWSGKRSLGDGKRAKAIKLLMLLVVVYYGMQTVKWLGNRFIMGSEKAQFQVEDQEPTTSVGKRTNSVKKPKTHRVIDPFDPVEGLLRNLPQFVQDTSMLHPEEDGLVHVNMSMPAERHPIYQIIKEARVKWDQKLKKQSRTLKEAVEEYKRRNGGRAPPKGFDQWWRFIVEQDVQLPDEYDQITKDMHLFRAISPTELNERIDHASTLVDTFTISVHQGAVRTRSTYDADAIPGANERLEGQIGLIMDFGMEKWLGDFRAIYGVHDSPQGFIGYDHRDDLMTRVEDGEYYDSDEELDVTVRGWPAACPFGSPAREFNRFTPVTKKNHMEKSFIADHSAQFDLCKFPEQQALHGMLSGRRPHVQDELLPVFSLSKTSLNTDILGVPVEQWVESMPSIPWDQRTQGRLMWRGSNTGAYHSGETTWRQSHRTRLVGMADKKARGELTLLPAPNAQHSKGYSIGANVLKASRAGVNNQMLDISFAGEPLQCEQEDGTCDELRDEYEFAEFPMTFEEALEHKFIVDVDGNTWSSRFERLLSGGSLIFKSTIMPEWWTQRAQPWVHYVPINLDYSDLHDALTFFRGDIYGNGGEDALAQQIAQEGQKWAETHWRRADMAAYVGRMYLEWARLLARDRRSMDFVYSPEMELEREELGGDEIY